MFRNLVLCQRVEGAIDGDPCTWPHLDPAQAKFVEITGELFPPALTYGAVMVVMAQTPEPMRTGLTQVVLGSVDAEQPEADTDPSAYFADCVPFFQSPAPAFLERNGVGEGDLIELYAHGVRSKNPIAQHFARMIAAEWAAMQETS